MASNKICSNDRSNMVKVNRPTQEKKNMRIFEVYIYIYKRSNGTSNVILTVNTQKETWKTHKSPRKCALLC